MSESNFMDEKSNIIEIKEVLRTSFYLGICCLVFTIIIMVIISIATISITGGYSGYYLAIFLPIIAILIIWLVYSSKRSKKFRRFTMSDEFIIIQVPNKPLFKVNLSDFDTIEVRRNTSADVFTSGRTTRYTFTFRGNGFTDAYIIKSQSDFSRKAIIEIREKLEEFSGIKGKQYIYKK